MFQKIRCFFAGIHTAEEVKTMGYDFYFKYAGEAKDAKANMQKALANLKGETNRKAQFRTVISLYLNGKNISSKAW